MQKMQRRNLARESKQRTCRAEAYKRPRVRVEFLKVRKLGSSNCLFCFIASVGLSLQLITSEACKTSKRVLSYFSLARSGTIWDSSPTRVIFKFLFRSAL